MKRAISLILAVLLCAALFTGCDTVLGLFNNESPVGRYVVKTINDMDVKSYLMKRSGIASMSDGEEKLVLEEFGVSSFEEIMIFELREDHSFSLRGIFDTNRDGIWEKHGSTLTLQNGEATFKDGEITMKVKDMNIVMVRAGDPGSGPLEVPVSGGSLDASGNAAASTEPYVEPEIVEGTYKLASIDGLSPLAFYEQLAAESETDAETLLGSYGVADLDGLPVSLGCTLKADGTGSFGQLCTTGIENVDGDWRRVGDTFILTIFNAGRELAAGQNGQGGESYSDTTLRGSLQNGELVVRNDAGQVFTYVKLEIGSAAGSYVFKSVDGAGVEAYVERMAFNVGVDADDVLHLLGLHSYEEMADQMRFTLNEDGTGTYSCISSDGFTPVDINWTQVGDKVTLTIHFASLDVDVGTDLTDKTEEYKLVDGRLVSAESYGFALAFVRTDVDADPAESDAPDDEGN